MFKVLLVSLSLCTLGACSTAATPDYDAKFGDAVKQAKVDMTLNPDAAKQTASVQGLDGKAALNATERYQSSFKNPPPVTNVINVGGSIANKDR